MDATDAPMRRLQIVASGQCQVIDDVYVLNGAICLSTFNYLMMKHGTLVCSTNIEGVMRNDDWVGLKCGGEVKGMIRKF